MQTDHLTKKVDHLLEWKRANMLSPNPEYQRGSVWTTPQKKRLVDSVMRGYPIPLIDLHHIRKEVAGAQRDDFEIIDGQQRIEALHEFMEGHFKLFDPIADEAAAQFPSFIKELPCRWAGKAFDELDKEEQIRFRDMLLVDRLLDQDQQELAVNLSSALGSFRLNVAQDRKARHGDYWVEYGQLTQTGSHAKDTIERRHKFFADKMSALLNPQPDDSQPQL